MTVPEVEIDPDIPLAKPAFGVRRIGSTLHMPSELHDALGGTPIRNVLRLWGQVVMSPNLIAKRLHWPIAEVVKSSGELKVLLMDEFAEDCPHLLELASTSELQRGFGAIRPTQPPQSPQPPESSRPPETPRPPNSSFLKDSPRIAK